MVFAVFSLLCSAGISLSLVKCGELARGETIEVSEIEAA
jgi:hypothetical protein